MDYFVKYCSYISICIYKEFNRMWYQFIQLTYVRGPIIIISILEMWTSKVRKVKVPAQDLTAS